MSDSIAQQELYNTIPEIVEAAFHSIFFKIQEGLGVTTGDEAAYWFSGSQLEQCQNVAITEFREYCKHEIQIAKQYAEEAAEEAAASATISEEMARAGAVGREHHIHQMPTPELPTEPEQLPDINDPYKRSKKQQADVLIKVIDSLALDPITSNVVMAHGWRPTMCPASNTMYYSSEEYEFVIYATPLYDDPCGIPVQAQWPDGRVLDLKTVHFNDITLPLYVNLVREHLPTWVQAARDYESLNGDNSRWLVVEEREHRISGIQPYNTHGEAIKVFLAAFEENYRSLHTEASADEVRARATDALRSRTWSCGEATFTLWPISI